MKIIKENYINCNMITRVLKSPIMLTMICYPVFIIKI